MSDIVLIIAYNLMEEDSSLTFAQALNKVLSSNKSLGDWGDYLKERNDNE